MTVLSQNARQPLHFPESFMGTIFDPLGAFVHDEFEESGKVIRVIPKVPSDEEQDDCSLSFDVHDSPLPTPLSDRTCGGKAVTA